MNADTLRDLLASTRIVLDATQKVTDGEWPTDGNEVVAIRRVMMAEVHLANAADAFQSALDLIENPNKE